jgi:hypothetical protein
MGRLKTTLINATEKPLELYEEASNASQRRISVLQPSGDKQQTVSKSNRNTGKIEIEGISPSFYEHSVDPNDSYSTLRLWFDKQAVVAISSDEMIDNKTITIKYENGVFKKDFEPRYEPRTSSDQSSDSTWRNQSSDSTWRNFFKGVWNNIKMHSKQ